MALLLHSCLSPSHHPLPPHTCTGKRRLGRSRWQPTASILRERPRRGEDKGGKRAPMLAIVHEGGRAIIGDQISRAETPHLVPPPLASPAERGIFGRVRAVFAVQ